MKTKYLYLEKKEYIVNWIKGGNVPLRLASRYLSAKRDGTNTPDEARLITGNPLQPGIKAQFDVGNLTVTNCIRTTPDGRKVPFNHCRRVQDGLILCLSNERSNEIARRLGKYFCIAIDDICALKKSFDQQLNCCLPPRISGKYGVRISFLND